MRGMGRRSYVEASVVALAPPRPEHTSHTCRSVLSQESPSLFFNAGRSLVRTRQCALLGYLSHALTPLHHKPQTLPLESLYFELQTLKP
jgi:hypothetical protein